MLTTPEEYLASIDSPGHMWLREFPDYMKANHPDIAPVVFHQHPIFKVGKSCVVPTVAKDHFSLHTLTLT